MVSTFKAVNAQGYQQIMGRFSSRLATSFLNYIGQESGQTILDLGCGTGSMAFALAQRGDHKSIVGIDLSEVYVEFARSRTDDARIRFEVADGSALPFEVNTENSLVSIIPYRQWIRLLQRLNLKVIVIVCALLCCFAFFILVITPWIRVRYW